MRRPCPICEGKCGREWGRNISMVGVSKHYVLVMVHTTCVNYHTESSASLRTLGRWLQSGRRGVDPACSEDTG